VSDAAPARVQRRTLDADAFRVVSARASLPTRLRNLWARRELLTSLITSDIRIKYKNSVLGLLWSMLTPALFIAIYFVVFSLFLKNGIPNFVIYLFSAMVVWNMFQNSLNAATGVIVVRAGLVKKVSFPREILALANVGASVVYFVIQVAVLGIVLAIDAHSPAWTFLWLLPIAFLALYFFTAAVAIVMSAVTVYLRDMEHFMVIILQLWFFMSPVVYSYENSIVPQLHRHGVSWLHWVYLLNPITLIMLTFQRIFYVTTTMHATATMPVLNILPTWPMSTYFYMNIGLLAVMVALFLLAEVIFGRLEGNFESEL
jgi:ABC-2 type transport system permease protein